MLQRREKKCWAALSHSECQLENEYMKVKFNRPNSI